MRGLLLAILVGISSLALVGWVEDPFLAVGSAAPEISGVGSDGKAFSLGKANKSGSVFVLFWKERCPHNGRASALYNSIAKAYGEKVRFVGVVPATQEGANRWAQQFQTAYPMVPDLERTLIKGYKTAYSICAFEIGKDGKVAAVFPGYGSESLAKLNTAMAASAGVKPAEIDLSTAPTRLTYG